MDIQSAVLTELFVLYPVIIPGWVSPVKPPDIAHGGIPKSLYDGQAQGLECLVDPWTELQLRSWTMAVDDRVDLYVNDDPNPVTGKTVSKEDEGLRVRLYVPQGYLTQGVNRLHYKVTRVGGNVESSRDLKVLYHLRPADGLDLMIPPDVIKDGVSADRAAQGVEFGFTYANRRPFDRIEFLLGDALVRFDVPDGTSPITHTLFTDTFQNAGDNTSAVAEFFVVDQLGNRVKSAEKRLDIHLGRVELKEAILREILTENNDDPAIVDLAKLSGRPLWALIHLIETVWNVGDEIHLTFTALVNGSLVATHEARLPITQVPGQFSWDIPNDKVIADSSVKVSYKQIRGGTLIATSKDAEANVIGEAALNLMPPFLVKPAVSPIDALAYPEGVTIRVEYLGALDGDKARLVEVNAPAGSPQFPLVAFNSNKRTNTVLTQAFLVARQGKEIGLRWNLNRGGGQAGKSPVVKLSVLKVADGDPRFPKPVIAGQTEQELDVSKLVATDQTTITQWPGQKAEQPVWLKYEGIDKNGAATVFDDRRGEPHTTPSDLNRPVPLPWLETLQNGSELNVIFKVNFYKEVNEAAAVHFPVRIYQIKVEQISLTENFDTLTEHQITSVTTSTMTITSLMGNNWITKVPPQNYEPDKYSGLVVATGNDRSVIRFDLKASYSIVSFWCLYVDSTCRATSYAGNGDTLEVLNITPPRGAKQYTFSVSGIRRIEIDNIGTGDSFHIDHFKFTH